MQLRNEEFFAAVRARSATRAAREHGAEVREGAHSSRLGSSRGGSSQSNAHKYFKKVTATLLTFGDALCVKKVS